MMYNPFFASMFCGLLGSMGLGGMGGPPCIQQGLMNNTMYSPTTPLASATVGPTVVGQSLTTATIAPTVARQQPVTIPTPTQMFGKSATTNNDNRKQNGLLDLYNGIQKKDGLLLDVQHQQVTVSKSPRRMCKECEPCQRKEDCGTCKHCLDKTKFCVPSTLRGKCVKRKCLNMIERMDDKVHYDDDTIIETSNNSLEENDAPAPTKSKKKKKSVKKDLWCKLSIVILCVYFCISPSNI